jgi:(p)ppGpp synthase/HD superfamily hydrolase
MQKVIDFIEQKHKGQLYGDAPYQSHLLRVANRFSTDDLYMSSLALLHDVIEDTNATYKEVKELMVEVFKSLPESKEVQESLVSTFIMDLESLTDNTKERHPTLNRSDRKSKYREQLQWASYNALSVKYADIIDNLSTVFDSGKSREFIELYIHEKDEILRYCTHGDWKLYKECIVLLEKARVTLKQG